MSLPDSPPKPSVNEATPTLYTIYKLIEGYNVTKNKDGSFNCKSYTKPINEILKLLEKNKGWHIRIDPNKKCIPYGDIDHLKDELYLPEILEIIRDIYNVTIDEISYTFSYKEDVDEYSYHWSIPSKSTTIKNLKWTFEALNKQYKALAEKVIKDNIKNKELFDISVYSSRWFRLPNQTNEDKPDEHNIIKGNLEDFIVEYIKPNTIELEDDDEPIKETIKPTKEERAPKKETSIKLIEGKTMNNFIIQLLDILDSSRADYWEKWRNIGFIIHTELGEEGYDIFNEFSTQSNKYNRAKVLKFWDSIKDNTDKPMTIKSLMKIAKSDNEDDKTGYNAIINEFIIPKYKDSDDKYQELKNEFEKNNFKILDPVSFATIRDDGTLILRNKQDFITVNENIIYIGKNKAGEDEDKQFIKKWLLD
jgi:hypothetical protein